MPQLHSFADDLWIAEAPLKFLGLHLGTRMTVVRLEGGSLLLHSPIAIDDALAREIDALGTVKYVLAPNTFHHLHAGSALARWPEARSFGAEGLQKKRPDLRLDQVLDDSLDLPFAGELEPLTIRGSILKETVLLHKRSGTLVSSDLLENFHSHDHLPTRIYLKVAGIHGKPGFSWPLRFVYKDRKVARESFDRLLRWDFDRAVIAHGESIASGARPILEQAYTWL